MKKNPEIVKEKEENREETIALQKNVFFGKEKKSVSSRAEIVEYGEISSSTYEWNTGKDELCNTCLSCYENKTK